MKEKVTIQDVIIIIDRCKSGGYDQYHDWSPTYNLAGKVQFLENMLKEWTITENDAKKLILQFIRSLIHEAVSSCLDITNRLVHNIHIREIISIGNEHISSGIFARDLLISMKNNRIKQEEWLLKINKYLIEKKFNVDKRTVNLKELYSNIQKLVSELSN